MAQSPTIKTARSELSGYLKSWEALGSMISRGRSFSGYEKNCVFLNTSTKNSLNFTDISAVSGIDFIDDGRALIATDWDHDGDLDIWSTNRTAPRIRFLKNNLAEKNKSNSVSFNLEGTTSNRDAIGTILKLKLKSQSRTHHITAGDGFLSQSSKRITFGINEHDSDHPIDLDIMWPDGSKEEFINIIPGSNYQITQGSKKLNAIDKKTRNIELIESEIKQENSSETARIVLTQRVKSPTINYVNFKGESSTFTPQKNGQSAKLINLWASWCAPCLAELEEFKKNHQLFTDRGLQILALSTDFISLDGSKPNLDKAKKLVSANNYPFEVGVADDKSLRLLTVMHNQIFSRERPLPLPTSFLIDRHGQLAVIYRGKVSPKQLQSDINLLNSSPNAVAESSWPFKGRDGYEFFKIGKLDFARAYQRGGYYEEALEEAQNYLNAEINNTIKPSLINQAKAWIFIAALEQSNKKWSNSAEAYLKAINLLPNQSLLKIQAGVVLWMSGQKDQANKLFTEASIEGASDPKILNTLGKAHQQIERENDAIKYFESAISLSPELTEYQINLAISQQRNNNISKAIQSYKTIISKNKNSINAKNNLAMILSTEPDDSLRDGKTALIIATEIAEETQYQNYSTLDTLAAALAENEKYDQAIITIKKAISIAQSTGKTTVTSSLINKLETYKSGKPFRKDNL